MESSMATANSLPLRPLPKTAQPSAAAPGNPEFLTNDEAAAFLRLSPRTLEKQRVLGGGPRYRKFGARVTRRRDNARDSVAARADTPPVILRIEFEIPNKVIAFIMRNMVKSDEQSVWSGPRAKNERNAGHRASARRRCGSSAGRLRGLMVGGTDLDSFARRCALERYSKQPHPAIGCRHREACRVPNRCGIHQWAVARPVGRGHPVFARSSRHRTRPRRCRDDPRRPVERIETQLTQRCHREKRRHNLVHRPPLRHHSSQRRAPGHEGIWRKFRLPL